MDLKKIIEKVVSEERLEGIIEKVAKQAENGDLKAAKLLIDYYFFPPEVGKNGQLKLPFDLNQHKVTFEKYGKA